MTPFAAYSRARFGTPAKPGLSRACASRRGDRVRRRLHALDRLIDIVCDAAGIDLRREGIDVLALKRRVFERI